MNIYLYVMLHLSYYYGYLYDDRTDCINNLLSNLKRKRFCL